MTIVILSIFLLQNDFYLAEESYCNYPYTQFSLVSTLGMKYVNDLVQPIDGRNVCTEVTNQMIRNDEVFNYIKSRGYKFVLFKSGIGATDRSRYADLVVGGIYSEFLKVLVHTSMLRALERRLFFADWYRENLISQFKQLELAHKIKGPKFVLCHFILPHPPFVFGPKGEPINHRISHWDKISGYREKDISVN